MLFDRPCSRFRFFFGSFPLVTLVWPHSSIEVRVASNHSILPSGHISFVPCYGSVLLSLPFGWLRHECCLHLLLWALWPLLGINASRYLIKCTECGILFFAWTSMSALRHCLRIHLDCLETSRQRDAQEQCIWFQACLERCRGGPWGKIIHPLGIPLAPTICLSGDLLIPLFILVGATPRRKVDGTDFGCFLIQS